MKIAITTVGTRGDLQPYVALGLGLKEAGHEVLIVSSQNEKAFVENYGLNFFPLSVDIQKLMEGGEVKEMAKGTNPIRFIVGHVKNSGRLKQIMLKTQEEIWSACQTADIIIFHPGMPLGFFMARAMNRISIMASVFPVVATREYPAILFYPGPRLGKSWNRITHKIFEKLFWALAKGAVEGFWMKEVRMKMNFNQPPIRQQIESGMLVLNGYSDLIFRRPGDWPANVYNTGYWFVDDEPNFVPPPGLNEFIEAGEAPVYFGFGSMKDVSGFRKTVEILGEALEMTGKRGILVLGWSTLPDDENLPANMFLAESIPHGWLFPKMKMVIHHGGAGTTAAGLRAGKPTIIIPHNADQPAWGMRVFELGLGPRPIKKSVLNARKLAAAILYAQQDEIAANAEKLGRELRKEEGVANAVRIIGDYIRPRQDKEGKGIE